MISTEIDGRPSPKWDRGKLSVSRSEIGPGLAAGGLSTTGVESPTLGEVLDRQSLVTDKVAIDELRRVLRELNIDLDE